MTDPVLGHVVEAVHIRHGIVRYLYSTGRDAVNEGIRYSVPLFGMSGAVRVKVRDEFTPEQ